MNVMVVPETGRSAAVDRYRADARKRMRGIASEYLGIPLEEIESELESRMDGERPGRPGAIARSCFGRVNTNERNQRRITHLIP